MKKIVLDALSGVAVSAKRADTFLPRLSVSLTGFSTGGGGADYTVEILLLAHLPSPYAQERSLEAIIWKGVSSGRDLMRYNPVSKKLVEPGGPISDRVYASVREVAARLAKDFKTASAKK